MAQDYEKQLQEIKEILEDIYTKAAIFNESLYYKMYSLEEGDKSFTYIYNDEIDYSATSLNKLIKEMINKSLSPNVDYVVYIAYRYNITYPPGDFMTPDEISPLYLCIKHNDYSEILRFFFDDFPIFFVDVDSAIRGVRPKKLTRLFIKDFEMGFFEAGIRDPLEQILVYRNLQSGWTLKPAYICGRFYENVELGLPTLNIATWRESEFDFIAYCTSLSNYIKLMSSTDIVRYNNSIDKIFDKALDKIKKSQELRELRKKLRKKEKWKACSKEVIEKVIHDEIEEANRVMRQYGILRVAVTYEEKEEYKKNNLSPAD